MKYDKIVHGGEYTIYGDWDDTGGYQVLVVWHPAKTCTVFVMGGSDYGGGISYHGDMENHQFEALMEAADSAYTFTRALSQLFQEREKGQQRV